MSKLISEEALIKDMCGECLCADGDCTYNLGEDPDGCCLEISIVKHQPAIEERPHANWVKTYMQNGDIICECDRCHRLERAPYPYCHMCGAIIDNWDSERAGVAE